MKIRVKIKKYNDQGLRERFQYADSAGNVGRDLDSIISGFINPDEEHIKLEIDLKKMHEKSPEEKAEFLEKQKDEKS